MAQACDEFGNARTRGGDCFKAAIRGLDGDAVAVTDRGDGSYGVRYTAPSEGTFSLAVTGADGCDVGGSPAQPLSLSSGLHLSLELPMHRLLDNQPYKRYHYFHAQRLYWDLACCSSVHCG